MCTIILFRKKNNWLRARHWVLKRRNSLKACVSSSNNYANYIQPTSRDSILTRLPTVTRRGGERSDKRESYRVFIQVMTNVGYTIKIEYSAAILCDVWARLLKYTHTHTHVYDTLAFSAWTSSSCCVNIFLFFAVRLETGRLRFRIWFLHTFQIKTRTR